MILEAALKYYGVAEVDGPINNPRILDWFSKLGLAFNSDECNWCGVFVGVCCLDVGVGLPKNPALARQWLSMGTKVDEPAAGDLVVFWRVSQDGWQGHVGIFINYADPRKEYINVLGGNQGNRVCIAPYESIRVLGFRRIAF